MVNFFLRREQTKRTKVTYRNVNASSSSKHAADTPSQDDSFVPNHVAQCRRLSELSIQKAPQNQLQHRHQPVLPDSSPSYRIQKEPGVLLAKNMRLSSAEERRKKQMSPSAAKPPRYSRIIKRVLERYDPSQNQVRSRMPVTQNVTKGVLA